MFIWDFDAIFAVAVIFGVGLVLTQWMIYNSCRGKDRGESKVSEYLKHCQYCGHVYLDYFLSTTRRCPRCSSYH